MKITRKISLSSQNYLYEVSSIPLNTRLDFLNKLLKRKSAPSQKNVALLKIIYSCVNENKFNRWDSDKICKDLDISDDMLYCHKSRLLSGLRKHYFNWNEIKKGLPKEKNQIVETLQFARKMSEIGMMREAKCKYFKLERLIDNYGKKEESYVMLSEIYEFLAHYYLLRHNKQKINSCIEKLDTSYTIAKFNYKLKKENDNLMLFRLNYSKLYIHFCNYYTSGKIENDYKLIAIIEKLADKTNNENFILKFTYHRGLIATAMGDFKEASKRFNEGFEKAYALKKAAEYYTFASMLYFLKRFTNRDITENKTHNICISNREIIGYYHTLKKSKPLDQWTIYMESSLVSSYYSEIKPELISIFAERIRSYIMMGDFSTAVYWKFILARETYQNKLAAYFIEGTTEEPPHLPIETINQDIHSRIYDECFNTLCYRKAFKDTELLWRVYETQLTAYFLNETELDYELTDVLINKMERTIEKSFIIPGFELLKVSIRMLKHSKRPKYMLSKYEMKFKKTLDLFKTKTKDCSLLDYAIVSSLARRLRNKEITAIVKDLYNWLTANHPEILAPALREIEEKKHEVYTIVGKEQSAA